MSTSPNRWKARGVGLGAAIVAALLIGPLAAPARAAFTPPVRLSTTESSGAKAAIDAQGDAIAIWSRHGDSGRRVKARLVSASGALGGPVKTISPPSDSPLWPQIAGDPDGGAIVVWSRTDGENQRIEARRISASGRLGSVTTISAKGATAKSPAIAGDAHGDAIVVWSQTKRGNHLIKARKISSRGGLGPVKTLSSAKQKSADPEIASDAHGDAVAVWALRGGANSHVKTLSGPIKARRISAKGRLGSVKTLSRPGQGAGEAQIAIDARGNAVAVWTQIPSKGRNRVKARRISAKGALGHAKTLATNADGPKIAIDARGDAVVVWDARHGRDRIQVRQIAATGALGPVQTVSTPGRIAYETQIAIDDAGNATTVWDEIDYTPQPSQDYVQTRQLSATGVLGPVQTLANEPTHEPQVEVNAEGDAFAVWTQFDFDNVTWQPWSSRGP